MWDYAISRTPISLPKLDRNNETKLRELLKPVEKLELPSDNESDCSSATESIPDAFKEYHKTSFLLPKSGTKFYPKREADRRTFALFSEDFRKTLRTIREEQRIQENLTKETEQDVEQELSGKNNYHFLKGKNEVTCDQIKVEVQSNTSELSSNSGIWNMIKANQRDYFSVSPPHYNLYNEEAPDHYLKRPLVEWKELETSRGKCLDWLKNASE